MKSCLYVLVLYPKSESVDRIRPLGVGRGWQGLDWSEKERLFKSNQRT